MKSVQFIVQGDEFKSADDGRWVVRLLIDGKLDAETGVFGNLAHALAAANDLAGETGVFEGADDDQG